ncbi:hypothetical protein M8J77_015520 [Diaphorina citri]|nr:hypothetical protein M8J77_015520 [Diaphorina citri]
MWENSMQNVRQRSMSWKSETKQLNDIIAYANTCACKDKEVIFGIQDCLFSLNKANKGSLKSEQYINELENIETLELTNWAQVAMSCLGENT